jgi:hypothetical protein
VALSAFTDKSQPPDDDTLAETLGPSARLWLDLKRRIEQDWPPVVEEWAHAGAKFGWSLRLRHKKRIVVYLIPGSGSFLVGVVLGDRAVAAAREAGLPPNALAVLDEAKRYAEGTGLRLEVRKAADLKAVHTLVQAKMTT